MPDELWTEVHDIVQEAVIKTISKKKKMPRGKIVVQRGLTNSSEKNRREKERYKHLNAEFQRIARRDKKAFLNDQCKEIEENNKMGKTGGLFKRMRYQGNFSCKDGHNKG